ncbi:beta-ketoacyl synthase chain length factor [Sulfurovum sp.]|uniref:beta-ketoacyl synthase chain length factor n=1 Tax=Sulfurovum sp. TaxID=1969726 RepID=UPI002867D906|nr:beta-ketoacyl synthase chain length factor [Sulfurovum sp.]
MRINLEILESAYVYAPKEIEELNTKELVPKMLTRRRLTRAAKLAIYLANKVSFLNGRIIYGSSFGELSATANILNSINAKEPISPTLFQNSVYNTAVSYLSMLNDNKNEIMTISSGDNTSLNLLKSGAIKSLDGDILLLLATETLNIDKIEDVNSCIDVLECGVALKVRFTQEEATVDYDDVSNEVKTPKSLNHMLNIAKNIHRGKPNIIEVIL